MDWLAPLFFVSILIVPASIFAIVSDRANKNKAKIKYNIILYGNRGRIIKKWKNATNLSYCNNSIEFINNDIEYTISGTYEIQRDLKENK